MLSHLTFTWFKRWLEKLAYVSILFELLKKKNMCTCLQFLKPILKKIKKVFKGALTKQKTLRVFRTPGKSSAYKPILNNYHVFDLKMTKKNPTFGEYINFSNFTAVHENMNYCSIRT